MNDIDVLEICQVTLDRQQQVQLDHYVALRAHRDRKDMAWEDDRGQLLRALGVAEAKLAESQKALAKLQSKYNRHKETMKVIEESYTELQAQVHQNQRSNATSASSHVVDSAVATDTKTRVLKREHSEVDWQQPQQQEGKKQQQQQQEGKLKRIPSARSASAAVAAAFRKGEADKRRRLEDAQQAAVAAAADAAAAAAGNKEDYLNEAHPLASQAGGRYAYPSVFPGSTPATAAAVAAAGQTNRGEVSIKKEQLSPTAAAATGGRGKGGGGGRRSEKAVGRGCDTAAAAAAPAKVSRNNGAGASSSSSSSSSGDGKKHQQQSKPRESKHVQSNLSKAARAQLPGRTCSECEAFYRMQKAKGVSSQDIRDVLNNCSRHRQQWTPPTTPDGFWDMSAMSMPTPAAVKQRPLDELR
jgi:hypothetical protein